jgi:hypothetical protein
MAVVVSLRFWASTTHELKAFGPKALSELTLRKTSQPLRAGWFQGLDFS